MFWMVVLAILLIVSAAKIKFVMDVASGSGL